MMSGISIGLGGYNAAITQFDVSANNIANVASAQGTGRPPDVDLAEQVIDTKIASYDAQASLKVLKVQNDVLRQALSILS